MVYRNFTEQNRYKSKFDSPKYFEGHSVPPKQDSVSEAVVVVPACYMWGASQPLWGTSAFSDVRVS